jgi:hypothetical protein
LAGYILGERREVPCAFGEGGDCGVEVFGRDVALAGEIEEDELLSIGLEQVRDVRGADEGDAEAVLFIALAGFGRAVQGVGKGVERAVAALIEDGSVGLGGVEVAEGSAAAASTTTAAAAATAEAAGPTHNGAENADGGIGLVGGDTTLCARARDGFVDAVLDLILGEVREAVGLAARAGDGD